MATLLFVVFLACVLSTAAFAVMGAVSDFRGFVIPNEYSLIIIAGFALAYAAMYFGPAKHEVFFSLNSHLIAAGIMFVITLGLYFARIIGAGDSKFAAAAALWAGLQGLSAFLFFMALVGGLLGAATLYLKKRKPFANPPAGSWLDKAQQGQNTVPYGIAIAAGLLVAMCQNGLLDFARWVRILGV